MKKRILSCLCALLLCLGVLSVPFSVRAAGTPCFLAINDNLQRLEDQLIPIAVDGQYYVPYTALDNSVTGLSLGIFPTYNSISNILTIYNKDQVLQFDLTANACTDRSGNTVSARAVIRNGRIYVPARFICEYFGLTYSTRTTTYGPLVRIRSASSTLDDNNFVGLAQMLMEDRLREWRKAQSSTTETPTVTPTYTPSVTPTPGGSETDRSGVRTYLAFRADRIDGLNSLLEKLSQYQAKALFFFPAEQLADYDAAVRSVLCEGHIVGLLTFGTTAEEVTAQVQEGNRLLTQIAHLNTYTVLTAEEIEASVREELAVAGLRCWNTDIDAVTEAGISALQISETADRVLGSANLYSEYIYILSDASSAGATLTGRILNGLTQDNYDLRLAVETQLN